MSERAREEKPVSADRHAQEEPADIGRTIAQLQDVAESGCRAPERHPVMRREYWMRRIDASASGSISHRRLQSMSVCARDVRLLERSIKVLPVAALRSSSAIVPLAATLVKRKAPATSVIFYR